MSAERDTHFQGFAKLLAQELHDSGLLDLNHADVYDVPGLAMQIIAERVYDLFVHDRMNTGTSDLQSAGSRLEAEMMIEGIPDMTEWPEHEDPLQGKGE